MMFSSWFPNLRQSLGAHVNLEVEPLEDRTMLAGDFLLAWATGLIVGDFNGSRGGIFVSRADGTDMRQITVSQTNNFQFSGDGINLPDDHPSISPDGTQIVFTTSRYQTGNETNNFEIAIMNVDGSNVRRLTNSPGIDTEPVFSPDGSKIAFASGRAGNLDIWVMNVDGSGLQRLTTNTDNENEPAWSHAGDRIAYTRILFGGTFGVFHAKKDSYVMNADGTNQRLIAGLEAEEHDAVWSLDDKRLILTSEKDGTLPFGDVAVIDIATRQYVANLTIDDSTLGIGGGGDPTLSPDGSKIAYFKATGGPLLLAGPQKIHVMNANGTGKKKIDAPGIINVHPHFGKLADSDSDGKPDYIDINSPADLDQALIQDEARVLAFLGNRVILDNSAELSLLAAKGYVPAHVFDSFQGMGVAFARDLDDSQPSEIGKPDVLLYQPDLNGLTGQRDPTDAFGDFKYRLIGWGYASHYNPKGVPSFGGFPADLWLVHEAGFHAFNGTFSPTIPANDSPKGIQRGDQRPSENPLTPWHPRLWDIHFFRRPGGGTPIPAIHDPFGRNLPGNPSGGNSFFYPNLPYKGRLQSGERIEAEEFDMGKDFGWKDSTAGNSGNVFRITDMDIAATLSGAAGFDIVNIRSGEFLQYTVDLTQTGKYDFTFRMSNQAAGATFHIEIDGVDRSGTLTIPVSHPKDASIYTSFNPLSIFLLGGPLTGRHQVRLVFSSLPRSAPSTRFDFFSITRSAAPTAFSANIAEIKTPADFTDFHVTYRDNAAIDTATIDGSDVLVTGPNGFSQVATLVDKSESTNASSVTATYRIAAAGTGWDSADNGIYSVRMQSQQVLDSTGVAVAAGQFAAFTVAIAEFELIENPLTLRKTLYASGTESSDTISLSRSKKVITVKRNDATLGSASTDELELIIIGAVGGKDVVRSTQINIPLRISGGADDDMLIGDSGNDELFGDAGDDVLIGGAGDDKLFGGDGNDTLDGGLGNNLLDEGPGQGGIVFRGTNGDDVIEIRRRERNGAGLVVFDLNGQRSVNTYRKGETIIVFAGDGDDIVEMKSSAGKRWRAFFDGQRGNDVLIGSAGNDQLDGGQGRDVLIGNAGDDLLRGDAGRDVLLGGLGNDVLIGSPLQNLIANKKRDHDVFIGGSGNNVIVDELF